MNQKLYHAIKGQIKERLGEPWLIFIDVFTNKMLRDWEYNKRLEMAKYRHLQKVRMAIVDVEKETKA